MKPTNLHPKLQITTTIYVLLFVTGTILSAQTTAPKPISKEGLFKAVQIGGLSSQELTSFISSMGVDFRLSDEERDGLLKSGLERTVVDAITANYHVPEAPKPTVLEKVVEQRGISFPVTGDSAKNIENAGGNRSLLGVLLLKQPSTVAAVETKPQQVPVAVPAPVVPVPVPLRTSMPVVKNIEQATLIKREEMSYPQLARKEKIAGTVKCEVYIDERGIVSKVHTVSGHPVLAAAAEDSIRKWRYNPARLDGKSVPSSTIVEVNFKPVAN